MKYFRESLALLSSISKRKFWILSLIKAAVGVLDVVALGFVGLIGQLALAESRSEDVSGLSERIISRISFGATSTRDQFTFLTVWVLFFFIGKAVLAYFTNARMFGFLAGEEIKCGRRLVEGLFNSSLIETKKRSSQQVSQVVTQGTIAAIPRVLGFSSVVIAEAFLLVLLGLLFVILEPLLTLVLSVYFFLIGSVMHFVIARPLEDFGRTVASTTSDSYRTIQESIRTFREIFVLSQSDFFVRRFIVSKKEAAEKTAHVLTLTTAPRHIVDTALIVGIVIVGSLAFAQNDAAEAARSISFILVAGTRVAPSLLAIQGALAAIRQAGGESEGVYELARTNNFDRTETAPLGEETIPNLDVPNTRLGVDIEIRDFSFTYPDRDIPALKNISITIPSGSVVGVSGESGSGKSTFVDAILGIIECNEEIKICGSSPRKFVKDNPGKLGYVPQETVLIEGSISENIAFGSERTAIDSNLVWGCLEKVGLYSLVTSLSTGIDTQVGEFGGFLSGGQKQRIGIARALYTAPDLLVLDESTSALDADSAAVIKNLIEISRESMTVIVISHQPDFISNCEIQLRFDQGSLLA